MSAYVVDDLCINRILAAISLSSNRDGSYPSLRAGHLLYCPDVPTLQALGDQMRKMNTKAVNSRYSERSKAVPYEHIYVYPSMMQVYKSLDSFLYQCKEGDVPKCKLFKALEYYHYELADTVIHDLPEYERAIWD